MNSDAFSADQPLFLTIESVAEQLGLSTATIRRAIRDGKLKQHRFGRTLRICRDDLQAYISLSRG
jgi:excisionase family DNA binding protein